MAVTGTTLSMASQTINTTQLRAVGGAISTAIASAQMVKTTDTGQVDWTTVTWITGGQTWGYEIWRFNDALQATRPCFVKVGYRQNINNVFQMTAQVGTGTDGAGNLTSMASTGTSVTTVTDILMNSSSVYSTSGEMTTIRPSYIYGDGSSLCMSLWPSHCSTGGGSGAGYCGMFYVERLRHTDGTPLGDSVMVAWVNQSNSGYGPNSFTQVILYSNVYPQPSQAGNSGGFIALPAGQSAYSSGVMGSDVYTYPWMTGFTPRMGGPSQILVGLFRGDMMAVGNQFTLSHYGADRTFVSIPYFTPAGPYYPYFGAGSAQTFVPALRIT